MKEKIALLTYVLVIHCSLASSLVAESAPDFANEIAPILNKYCVGCHSEDEPEADLVLTSHAAILKGGENGSTIDKEALDKSLLIAHLTGAIDPIMPPEDEPRPGKEEMAKLVAWVKAGAKNSARTIDPGSNRSLKFEQIAPADGPSPITSIAYGAGDRIILVGEVAISGVDINSKKGLLVPAADAKPFTFLLSNTKERITYGHLGRKTTIEGELKLGVKYLGPKDGSDLNIDFGVGPDVIAGKYKFDEIVAVGRFGAVEVYSEDTERLLNTPGKVHALQFANDGKKLLAASGIAGVRGEAILWDAEGNVLQRFEGHRDAVYTVAISNDAKLVATGSYDRQIILWDVESGQQLRTLKGHNGAIYDLDFSPDSKVIVSASADATIKVWNVETGERLDTLGQPLKEQYSVDISPDGKRIIAGGEDNRIRVWELVSINSAKINPIKEARFAHEGAIEHVRYTRDGKRIVSSSTDGTVKIWEAETLSLVKAYEKPANSSAAFAVSRHDQRITVGTNEGDLKAFSLDVKQEKLAAVAAASVAPKVIASDETETYEENEPNSKVASAQVVKLPATISGRIHSEAATVDQDLYKFAARAGEQWIFEVKAARKESPLDSHIAILDANGKPVPRVQLQAVRDTYFTFRGKDSNATGDFRLHNWEEMQLNQLLYSSGEVVKLFHYPRGPDSGFNVYPNFGKRRGFFDTTPVAHALHEPAYIVEPHPPGEKLAPNGLPVFQLNYENDDDSQRRLGDDSRLTFVAPKDGEYVVAIRDIRGHQGEDFSYELMARVPKPDFNGKVTNKNPKVGKGSGKKFGIEVERIDGFFGPIDVTIKNLPDGFEVPGPLRFEPHHDRVWGTLLANENAATPTQEQMDAIQISLSAEINGESITHDVGSLGKIELVDEPKLLVQLVPDFEPTRGSSSYPVVELTAGTSTTATIKITRKNHEARVGFGNESGAVNAPHGVYVDNIGLNGVLIVEGQNERQFFITAEPWVKPMERVIFVETGDAGGPTSNPVLLRILPRDEPKVADQASK